jgi:hypothetical protein
LRSRYCLEVEQAGGLANALVALVLVDTAQLEREAHVLRDVHVRVERVVLEDHRDVAVLGREVGDVLAADPDAAAVHVLEPASMRSAVDLPEPDGPTRTMNSPSSICRSRESTAAVVPPG